MMAEPRQGVGPQALTPPSFVISSPYSRLPTTLLCALLLGTLDCENPSIVLTRHSALLENSRASISLRPNPKPPATPVDEVNEPQIRLQDMKSFT